MSHTPAESISSLSASRLTPWVAGVAIVAWALQSAFASRPGSPTLVWVLATQAVTWLALAWMAGKSGPMAPHWIWPILFRLAAVLSPPLLEDDWARYLWDGWRLIQTGSPYGSAPADFFQDPAIPDLLQQRLSEINNPDLPTIYGPTLQLGFGLSAFLSPGALWPWKSIALASDIAVLFLLRSAAGGRAAALYGWCPLAIHECCVNAHADILAILPLAGAWLACLRNRWITAGALLGLAASGKIFAWVAVPFLLGPRHPKAWLASIATWLVLHLPFWLQSNGGTSLGTFANTWEFNSSMVGILGGFLPPAAARIVALGLAAPILCLVWHRRRPDLSHPPLHLVYGVLFLASAVVNPWYLLWMLPFAAASPSLTAWVAMAAVPISYATALNLGIQAPGPYWHPVWVRPLEYGLIATAALAEIRLRKRKDVTPESPGVTPC